MEWGWIVLIVLAAAGAAFVAGGLVAYFKGGRALVKAVGAGSVAAGIVMLALVVATVPVTRTVSNGYSPEPVVETG
ncbi:MAG: hypothetical protein O2854_05980 [Chloroflexi bacterium]|nr:hypothetical protein [Chloroflexota bacterium]